MQVGGVLGFYCVVDVKDAGGACRESAGEGFFFSFFLLFYCIGLLLLSYL